MKNLHSHTQFCDGRSTMDDMIRAARETGFSTWGFSPHSPVHIESPCNMRLADVPVYLAEISRLREAYPDIELLAGMEVDFLDENDGPGADAVRDYGLDFVIGSVHFIPDKNGVFHDIDGSAERFVRNLREHFDNDLGYVVRTFWKQSQKMIESGGLDIVGHIDKIAQNASFVVPEIENDAEYRSLAMETINLAISKGLAIEINTKHRDKFGRFYPNPIFWKHILEHGIEMPVNSDAHDTVHLDSGMQEALRMKERILKEISSAVKPRTDRNERETQANGDFNLTDK